MGGITFLYFIRTSKKKAKKKLFCILLEPGVLKPRGVKLPFQLFCSLVKLLFYGLRISTDKYSFLVLDNAWTLLVLDWILLTILNMTV